MTKEIRSAIEGFDQIVLGGIPFLLKQNETAFLSFMCSVAAIDALAAYRYTTGTVGERFVAFIKEYFPAAYAPHADNLYQLRCRLLHNFSPAYFTLAHALPGKHLQGSKIGDTILSDNSFFADLEKAAQKFFNEVQNDATSGRDECSPPQCEQRWRNLYRIGRLEAMHVYEVRPRKDKRGVSLISDALPFGRLWYGEPDASQQYAVGHACDSRLR